ncbi:tRNA glutamyl-Q(34) synthetase GluQRS [Spelaeicoccus albus]|uniref:Glutamyl-tRNA synthetase n=1 Tax=Spelaeicoccus albus TaxID=1280376 RepID=A0A7Z0IJA5_9MICO|nr:tRNA glutamyl-Q(34) synthetase GluQRS [Spelaeicoccus albus]NYI69350.1 glutamyl-tRNA synthetase [Spelaeicoccus albus]
MTSSHPSPRGAGRFAPSPSGPLHLGNLRTALLAWLFARSTGRRFLLRVEDLDADRSRFAGQQLDELQSLGLTWDGEPVYQSDRLPLYREALDVLREAGHVYECFCSRREIRQAASAPHSPVRRYPGTCRNLTDAEVRQRRRDRAPALRLRTDASTGTVHDLVAGVHRAALDDMVLQRRDGTPAYNLAVVVDDAACGIDQVVRADDLLDSAVSQAYLAGLLDLPVPEYAHVPLAVGRSGRRLAKRDGDVTLERLAARGRSAQWALDLIASSLSGAVAARPGRSPAQLLDSFDPALLPAGPWSVPTELP